MTTRASGDILLALFYYEEGNSCAVIIRLFDIIPADMQQRSHDISADQIFGETTGNSELQT